MNVYYVRASGNKVYWVVAESWDEVYALIPKDNDVIETMNYSRGAEVLIATEHTI